MGVHENISAEKFPLQGEALGKEAKVFFNFEKGVTFKGKIVRDDMEAPFITIIALEDGRYVLATECQYSY